MLWNYKNFSEDEFKCSCPCGGVDMDPDFMIRMVRLRMALDAPVIISSGWRCVSHNADVGGAEHSPHLDGCAADIKCHGTLARKLIGAADFCGFSGIGVSQRGDWGGRFIHLDSAKEIPERPRPWIWSY